MRVGVKIGLGDPQGAAEDHSVSVPPSPSKDRAVFGTCSFRQLGDLLGGWGVHSRSLADALRVV